MALYQHLAVASTFSPRFRAVLAEAARLATWLESPLSVIHADARSEDAEKRFREALAELRQPDDTLLLWAEAPTEQPTDAILDACQRGCVDLLIAGALERENDHRFFLGGVARGLLQRTPCDLFLITNPEELETPVERVIVEVDLKNPDLKALHKACGIAQKLRAKHLLFIGVQTPFDEATSGMHPEWIKDERQLVELLDPLDGFDGEADARLVRSTTGFGVCDFVQNENANLLIVVTGQDQGCRTLPQHMDWLLQVIPTNLLLIASAAGCMAE
jgi:nucleotide-binding universal stress UspA family protein